MACARVTRRSAVARDNSLHRNDVRARMPFLLTRSHGDSFRSRAPAGVPTHRTER